MRTILKTLLLLLLFCSPAMSHTWTVAPGDSLSVLSSPAVQPGDEIDLAAGVYHWPFTPPVPNVNGSGAGFPVTLRGTAAAPIAVKGQGRVTIDGGMSLVGCSYLTVQGLEITVVAPRPDRMPLVPSDAGITAGGIYLYRCDHCTLSNLTIHHNCQGLGVFESDSDTLVQGCSFWDNSYTALDGSTHGHDLYIQHAGTEHGITVAGCYVGSGADNYSLHAYGQAGHVQGISVVGCVFDSGGNSRTALLASYVSVDAVLVSNSDFYRTSLDIGYPIAYNGSASVTGIASWETGSEEVNLTNFEQVTLTNNLVAGWGGHVYHMANYHPPADAPSSLTVGGNQFLGSGGGGWGIWGKDFDPAHLPALWSGMSLQAKGQASDGTPFYFVGRSSATLPAVPTVHVRVQGSRALVDVFNWQKAATVSLDLSALLKVGDAYRVLNPEDPYGDPVASGTYTGPVVLPCGEFGAWWVEKTGSNETAALRAELDGIRAELDRIAAKVNGLQ